MDKKLSAILLSLVFFAMFFLTGCGDNNIFGWSHKTGSGSNVSSLSSDAYSALQNKDYAKALEYYSKILESEPGNSEAIYGYSAAKLGDAGLDISSLVANLIQQQSAPSAAPSRLSPAIAELAKAPYFSSSASMLPDTIMQKIDKISAAVNDILSNKYLLKIIKGQGDGSVSPDNPDLNINIAFCLVLRAAITAHNSGIDFQNDYSQSGAGDTSEMRSAAKDLVSAYHRLLVVIAKLNLSSDAAIANIQSDIKSLFNSLPVTTIDLNYDYYLNS
ncbi:MAG: hypothetical protein NT145_07575 [Elusimicrobia bacterium]|nr:hypothetical protein [Elusimicrobiota bacterium]